MQKAVPLQTDIYNILINKKYNNFTIAEFRDELVNCSCTFTDKNMARKFIYRQVYRLLNKGLLNKIKNNGDKKARYIKSELFQMTSFKNKDLLPVENKMMFVKSSSASLSYYKILENEKAVLRDSLIVIQSEVSTYDEFIDRFPNQRLKLKNLKLKAMNNIANLVGRINAVTNVLNSNASKSD